MTITVQPARNEYTANAGQTIFNYTFKIFADTDLNVYITPAGEVADDDTQLTTAYTVTGIGDEDGGSITLMTGTNQDDLVTIVSNIPSSRTIDYQNNGDFRPVTVNSDFDRVVSIAKKIEDTANRTVLLEQSQQANKPLSLESPVAGLGVRWNGGGTGLENYDTSTISNEEIGADKVVINYQTLNVATADSNLKINQACNIKERATGKGGGAMWDVVLAASVTTNGFNIVACTGVPTLALVLRLKEGAIDVAAMGAIADNGITNNSPVFFAARDTGNPILVPRSSLDLSYALANLVLLEGQRMYSNGATLSSFGNNSIVVRHNNNSVIHGFKFIGSGKNSGNTGEIGVDIFQTSRSQTFDCQFKDMGGSAYEVEDIVNNHEGNVFVNYIIESCNYGIHANNRGEYQDVGNGSISLCNEGMRIEGGNFNGHGTVISDNGIGIHLVAGSNDAHGQVNGCLLNHNGVVGDPVNRTIKVSAPNNGFLFNGLQMFNGGAIELINCHDIWFRNCVKSQVEIIEDGCVQCGFQGNDFLDSIDNTPNANGNASEVFYLDNNLPNGSVTTGSNGLGGGFLRLEQGANITNVPVGDSDLDWDTVVTNALTGNLNYTVQQFYGDGGAGTANPFIRADSKFVRMQGALQVQSQLTIGKSGSPAWVADEVTVKLVDTTGAVVGFYSPMTQASDPAVAETIRYHFNGVVPRNAFKTVIENNSGAAVTLYRQQTGTDILAYMVVQNW